MWLVSIWFLDNRKKNDYSNINVTVPNQTLSVVSASSSFASAQTVINASVSATDTNTSVASVSSQAKVDVTRNPSVSTGSDKLDFYFRDECWVEVSDANGDVLVTELQMKDTQLTLKGQSPFEIKLGNAPSVSLKLNDENVALVPALGTNVLMLKVGHKSGT
jgi:cytoskeleton protein RodZ